MSVENFSSVYDFKDKRLKTLKVFSIQKVCWVKIFVVTFIFRMIISNMFSIDHSYSTEMIRLFQNITKLISQYKPSTGVHLKGHSQFSINISSWPSGTAIIIIIISFVKGKRCWVGGTHNRRCSLTNDSLLPWLYLLHQQQQQQHEEWAIQIHCNDIRRWVVHIFLIEFVEILILLYSCWQVIHWKNLMK